MGVVVILVEGELEGHDARGLVKGVEWSAGSLEFWPIRVVGGFAQLRCGANVIVPPQQTALHSFPCAAYSQLHHHNSKIIFVCFAECFLCSWCF